MATSASVELKQPAASSASAHAASTIFIVN